MQQPTELTMVVYGKPKDPMLITPPPPQKIIF